MLYAVELFKESDGTPHYLCRCAKFGEKDGRSSSRSVWVVWGSEKFWKFVTGLRDNEENAFFHFNQKDFRPSDCAARGFREKCGL